MLSEVMNVSVLLYVPYLKGKKVHIGRYNKETEKKNEHKVNFKTVNN